MNNSEENILRQEIQNLTDLNDELENYFKNTMIPQLFVDADFILRKFTPPAMKQFDLALEHVGKSIEEIKDNFRFPTIKENIQWVIDENKILEKEIQTTDCRWYQMNIFPYVNHRTKKTNGVIITFVEITSRIKDLKDLERLISDHETLLDTISHDIKNPLTSLTLTIQMLKDATEKPEKLKSLIKVIENSVVTMKDIIVDLTESRKKEHKYKTEVERLSFENILEDVRLSLTDLIAEKSAELEWEVNASEITFSRRKLRSILYNLVSNGIKYQSPDRIPKIFIKTEKEGDFVIITVKDNGMGIDRRDKDNIFSKYFRVKNEVEGTGIGLYLVKEIITSSGGKIEVESEPGKGSTFKVYLKVN